MNSSEIYEKAVTTPPKWMERHDHFWTIPFTKSYVFYPYTIEEADEEELNLKYNPYGYQVIRRPKSDSEYRSGEHITYKVLILESNYDKQKIDQGCELLAQLFYEHFSKGGTDLYEK